VLATVAQSAQTNHHTNCLKVLGWVSSLSFEELSTVTDSDSASDSGAASASGDGDSSFAFGAGAGFDFGFGAETDDSLSAVDSCEVFLRFDDILTVV
jgi:hypothetical protein